MVTSFAFNIRIIIILNKLFRSNLNTFSEFNKRENSMKLQSELGAVFCVNILLKVMYLNLISYFLNWQKSHASYNSILYKL